MQQKSSNLGEKIRAVVRTIPAGQTLSYSEVARRAGNPKAARAVARVMSQNYDETIPCHRVIHSDGRIGNYNRGGEEAKRSLLIAEGWQTASRAKRLEKQR